MHRLRADCGRGTDIGGPSAPRAVHLHGRLSSSSADSSDEWAKLAAEKLDTYGMEYLGYGDWYGRFSRRTHVICTGPLVETADAGRRRVPPRKVIR